MKMYKKMNARKSTLVYFNLGMNDHIKHFGQTDLSPKHEFPMYVMMQSQHA